MEIFGNTINKIEEILRNYGLENRGEDNFATSLDIARILEKRHDNILRDIRNSISALSPESIELGDLRFEDSTYYTSQNKVMPLIIMNQFAFLHIITKYNDDARAALIALYRRILELRPPRPEQLIRADFTTADLAWEHLQEIAFIKDRLSKAKTQEEIDHWNNLIKEEENKFIEECKKYNLY